MFYEEFDPAPHLGAHVAHYWVMTVGSEVAPGFGHTIYPTGCVSLACLVRASGAEVRIALVGPRPDAFSVPVAPGDRYWGVTLWPDAGGLTLGVPARSLAGIVGDATAILGERDTAALRDGLRECVEQADARRAMDRVLEPRVVAAPGLDPAVRAAVVGLVASRGEVAIGELASGLGVSPRQLQRRFGDAVGLSPKQFARIRRFRSAIGEVLSPNPRTWSAVAAELGYADQSHLVREFVKLGGKAPAAVARGIRAITHGRVTP